MLTMQANLKKTVNLGLKHILTINTV